MSAELTVIDGGPPLVDRALELVRQGYSVFPCLATKKPACAHGFKQASRDESTVRSLFAVADARLIGVPTGPTSGFDALDVDPDGMAWLEANRPRLPITREHGTPRGGRHLIFEHPAGRRVKSSASQIAPGVDIRGDGAYVIWWASHDGSVTNPDLLVPWPEWLLTEIDRVKKRSAGPVAAGGRNDKMISAAGRLRHDNVPEAEAWKRLNTDNTEQCIPPLDERELRKIFDSAWQYPPGDSQNAEVLAEMNAKHAIINWEGRTLVLTETVDPTTHRARFQLSSVADKRTWFANTPHVGKTPRFDWWLRHSQRRQYLGIVFEPLRDSGAYYNLWRGWGVKPREGDCSLWLAMVRDAICSGDEKHYQYVMTWCADAVQNPTKRPGIVLVLRGPQGVGKGVFARTLGRLYGDHFLQIIHSQHLVNHFNAYLVNVLLLFTDEAYFPGDRKGEGALKGVITEPQIAVEYKGKDIIFIDNNVRVVMASNSEWVVPASLDDRRFATFEVARERAQDTAYFGEIMAQLEAGGYEALLHLLLNYRLGDVDLRKIPDTKAREEQQLHSLDSFQAFWLQWLQEPGDTFESDPFVITAKLYGDYKKAAGPYAASEVAFGMRLTKLFPTARRERRKTAEFDGRPWGYTFPPLAEMRKNFNDAFGKKIEWQPDDKPKEKS